MHCGDAGIGQALCAGDGKRLYHRVGAVTAGVQLVFDIPEQEPCGRRVFPRAFGGGIGMGGHKTLRARQTGAFHAVGRRDAGIAGLAHGAELRLEARGPGCAKPCGRPQTIQS